MKKNRAIKTATLLSSFLLLLAACHPYGEKIEMRDKLLYYPRDYYRPETLISYMDSNGYYEDGIREIHLAKEKTKWIVRVPVRKGTENEEEAIRRWKLRTVYLSNYITKPDIELTDDKFNTVKIIPNALDDIGKPYLRTQYVYLFVVPEITDEEANRLYNYLVQLGIKQHWKEDEQRTYQVRKQGGGYVIGNMVKEGLVYNDQEVFYEQILGVKFSEEVFHGSDVDIVIFDKNFKTIRTFLYNADYKSYYHYYKQQGQI